MVSESEHQARRDEIYAHRQEAVQCYQNALQFLAKGKTPWEWGRVKLSLANTFGALALTTRDETASIQLLAASRKDYGDALTVFTRTISPQDWMLIHYNTGIAFSAQAQKPAATDKERIPLLQSAASSFRLALEVNFKDRLPQDWARAQNNLATTLYILATKSSEGAERLRLLTEIVQIYRQALTVRTKEASPQDWVRTQNNLANTLHTYAQAAEGAERSRALTESVQAYQQVLTVWTREAFPQDWARTQNNLANALSTSARTLEGAERKRLLAESVQAYRQALTVRMEVFPQYWVRTQTNFALALDAFAQLTESEERERLKQELEQIVIAVKEFQQKNAPAPTGEQR
jgi:tetratricopeptide (TPR) repeat protein